MSVDSFQEEPPLHAAVLKNDLEAVIQGAKKETWRDAVNSLGFTALELAHFLGRRECANILDPSLANRIRVHLRGEGAERELSPDEFQGSFRVMFCPFLRFESYSLFKDVLRNCPWILALLGKENRDLGVQYRKQLSKGYTADTVIKWIDEQLGYGLFAVRDIPEGAFIGEYTGRVRRLFRRHPDPNAYCFHYPTRFWSWNYFVVDSLKEGNALRFINHSDQPNLQPMCLLDRGLLHQVFFAKRKIKRDTQLTFDYGHDYWIRRKKIECP
jgi:hypothetical protein